MSNMTLNSFISAGALLCVSFAGCAEDPITTLDRSSDCADICKTYKDCVASDSYDVNACGDRCTDMKSSDETKRIDDCSACLSGKSCVSSVFQCTTECAGIVP
jgi:hypothetical protein